MPSDDNILNDAETVDQEKPDRAIPSIGDYVDSALGPAYVDCRNHNGKNSYSVTARYNTTDDTWYLNNTKRSGLRIMLGNEEPKGYVTKVKITKYCFNKTSCCFGIVVR